MFGKAIETAHYFLNQRPLYIEPRGSKNYRSSNLEKRTRADALGRAIVNGFSCNGSDMLGANCSDYYVLHRYISEKKPSLALELGTGITTGIISEAMESANHGQLITVDHIDKYSRETRDRLSQSQRSRVEFCVTPALGDRRDDVDVIRYREIPDRPYDFVFVDGPPVIVGRTQFPGDDAISILERSIQPIDFLIDRRICTLNYLSSHLDVPVVYDPALGLGAISRASKHSLLKSPKKPHLKIGCIADTLGFSLTS